MSRATAVYVVTFVALVAGLWVVLGFGGALEAQPDFAGTWELENDVSVGGWPPLGRVVRVEQSGLFVRLLFDGGPVFDLKITERRVEQRGDRRVPVVVLADPSAPRVEAAGHPEADALRLRFAGQSDAAETSAARTERTYAPEKGRPHH